MIAIETINLEKTYAVGFWRKKPRVALRPLNLTAAVEGLREDLEVLAPDLQVECELEPEPQPEWGLEPEG